MEYKHSIVFFFFFSPERRALLFWFFSMTLLGWVPVESLAETGSNVKLAGESRKREKAGKKGLMFWKEVLQYQPFLFI